MRGASFFKTMMSMQQQKIRIWKDKLVALEEELVAIMQRKGEAAQDGDLRENAAYQSAVEDADLWRAKIGDVRKIISDLEKNDEGKR
ncbi:hypothetical protein HY389_00075 [Candidatus Daviesbacteria bacterium]|nr:hypothetical protein [Candidatus Daviesbacteria bacterium]